MPWRHERRGEVAVRAMRATDARGRKTPFPNRLMRDGEFLRRVRILLDGYSTDPERVRRAQEAALKIVGPSATIRKIPAGGVELASESCRKFPGKGAAVAPLILRREVRPVPERGRELG